jgi:chromate reductase
VPMMQMPEAYLGRIAESFDADGQLVSDKTRAFLQKFIDAYAAWVNLILAGGSNS